MKSAVRWLEADFANLQVAASISRAVGNTIPVRGGCGGLGMSTGGGGGGLGMAVLSSVTGASIPLQEVRGFRSLSAPRTLGCSSIVAPIQPNSLKQSAGLQTCRGTGNQTTTRSRKPVRSSYSRPGTSYSSPPIDVIADVRTEKIVVLGGNGFVGSAVAKEAVERNIEVVSLNRSGRPPGIADWADKVLWISGDVFTTDWDSVLLGATAVITTLGGFGSQEQMERLNGDANVAAVNAASAAGIGKFVMISVHDYNLPDFALRSGYFTGKRRAEKEVLAKYPKTGTILRPAFIYGTRRVNGINIPLGIIGGPLEQLVARTSTFTRPLARLPGSDVLLAPPVSVTDVARAALNSVKDDTLRGILDIEQIKNAALPVTSM